MTSLKTEKKHSKKLQRIIWFFSEENFDNDLLSYTPETETKSETLINRENQNQNQVKPVQRLKKKLVSVG